MSDVLSKIEEEVFYKNDVNYYDNKLVGYGWLVLTNENLMFLNCEKTDKLPVVIPITDVDSIEYGSVFRHIKGAVITKMDSTQVGFLMIPQEVEALKNVFHTVRNGIN